MIRRLGYLSGAVRVSTRPNALASGARAHVSGVISAYKELGWDVSSYILGDRVPDRAVTSSSQLMRATAVNRLATDAARISMRLINRRRCWRELRGKVDWVYERFASFQALGEPFHRAGIPWILETNGAFYEEARTERKTLLLASAAKRCEIAAYRDCDVLICVSDTLRQIVCDAAQIDSEKIVVVPNGVDTVFFDPSKHVPRRVFDDFTIGFVGRLNAWQGIDILLEALRELSDEGLKDVYLVLVGDGAMRAAWERKTQTLGLTDRVRFLGQIDFNDIPPSIAGVDIGFSGQVPTQNGKMYHSPLKIYEYMAMGKPVIGSAYADSQQTIEEGKTGFLFPPSDKQALKNAIKRAYERRDHLKQSSAEVRRQITAKHSWVSRVSWMNAAIERVLEHRNATATSAWGKSRSNLTARIAGDH